MEVQPQKISAQEMYHKYMSTGAAKYMAKRSSNNAARMGDDGENSEAVPKD